MAETTIYSPYTKVYDFWAYPQSADVLAKIRDYLLLLPCEACPEPITTNNNPRARLMKYLYYDTPNPLDENIPTVEQRLQMVFDPYNPDKPPSDKGYRIFTQGLVNQAQITGQTILRMFYGRVIPSEYSAKIGLVFQVMSNYTTESNTRTINLSRVYAMEEAIVEALNGVNIQGLGTINYSRNADRYCGSTAFTDEQYNVGREIVMYFESIGTNNERNPMYGI